MTGIYSFCGHFTKLNVDLNGYGLQHVNWYKIIILGKIAVL